MHREVYEREREIRVETFTLQVLFLLEALVLGPRKIAGVYRDDKCKGQNACHDQGATM
jgi:hypothetical protein